MSNEAVMTCQAQAIINKVLEGKNTMMYAINPDGSFVEIQPGCTLLSMDRYQMETYVKTIERKHKP